jgi:hypothetical protein
MSLRLQDAVLFAQVQDDLVLLTLEPAEEGRDEELHRNHGAESTPIAGRGFRTQRDQSGRRRTRRSERRNTCLVGGVVPKLTRLRDQLRKQP